MKKAVSGLVSVSLVLFTAGYVPAFAAITGTFTAVTTVTSVAAVNDQSAVAATTVANVVVGADDTQAATWANTQANSSASTASVTVDGNIVLTADTPGAVGNGISLEIVESDVDLGSCAPPGDPLNPATIVISKTGNAILATIQHNSNPTANCVASVIDVTYDRLAEALNMSSNGSILGGMIDVTITDDVSGLITASGGNMVKVSSPMSPTSLAGGLDGVTQEDTITISGAIEEGDVFTADLPGPDATYVAQAGDDADDVAFGLNAAIVPLASGFSSGVVGNVITLTATIPGTPFTVTADATNRTAVAQETTFTPASVIAGETFRSNINGSYYNYLAQSGDGVAEVTAGIVGSMDGAAGVSCTEDGTKVTCTGDVAGVPFTYSATVVDETAPVITLNGTASTTVQYTDTFVDPGATTDDGSSVVVGGDTVDTNVVADYTITYDSTDSNGNVATQKTRVVHVVPAPSFTSVSCPASVTYSGLAQTPCSASVTGVGGLSQSLTVNYTNNTNAGTASADASFAGDSTHAASSDSKNFTIDKQSLTATANNKTITYGDAEPVFDINYSGFVNSETESVLDTAPTASVSGPHTDVNSYVISASGGVDGNYDFSYVAGTYTINPKSLTASALASDKVYDGTTLATAPVSLSGIVGVDDVSASGSASFADKHVGTNKTVTVSGITLSGTAVGNYTLSNSSAVDTADITAAPLTVTAVANTKVYDGDTSASGAIVNVTGLQTGDSANFIEIYDNKNVGTGKTLTLDYAFPGGLIDGNSGNNYTVSFVSQNLGVITPASVTVSATGHNKIYDGTTDAAVDLNASGVIGLDVVNATGTAAFADANVAAGKDVHVSGIVLGGTDAGNYTANTTADTTADITAFLVNVTADAQTKVYGDLEPALTYTADALIGLDTYSGVLVRNVGEDVGIYAINQGTLTAGSNYSINYTGDNLTITQRPLTVDADSFTKEYLAADPSLTYVLTSGNLVGVDAFSGALTRDAGEDLGVYNITQGTLTAGANYDLTFNNGTLTIGDTIPPVISLTGGDNVTAWTNNGYVEQGAVVTDNHDVGLTAVITGSVDDDTPGTYFLTYTATDSSGNTASSTRTIGILQSGGGGGGSSSGGGQVLGGQVLGAATDVNTQIAALKAQIAALIQQLLALLQQQLAAALLGLGNL